MTVHYEWTVELIDQDGDILDVDFYDTLEAALMVASCPDDDQCHKDIGLVKHICDDSEDRVKTGYAYLLEGDLELEFNDAYGRSIGKVPARFHKETERNSALIQEVL